MASGGGGGMAGMAGMGGGYSGAGPKPAPEGPFSLATHTFVEGGGITKVYLPRTQPLDRTKAAAYLQTIMANAPKTKAEAEAMGYTDGDGGSHIFNPNLTKDGVNDPTRPEGFMLEGDKVVGAVFTMEWGETPPDAGMGMWHIHPEGSPSPDSFQYDYADLIAHHVKMQHVMFMPDNLDAAFSDTPGNENYITH
jgi:hypothetical protein